MHYRHDFVLRDEQEVNELKKAGVLSLDQIRLATSQAGQGNISPDRRPTKQPKKRMVDVMGVLFE